MTKIIVSIVSEQTTPNLVFIKEMIQSDDELLFISSKKFENRIDWIINALGCTKQAMRIILDDGAEECWTEMISQIKEKLSFHAHYIVNMTGGTKFMISAIPVAFQDFNTEYYYIPFPKNVILKIGTDEQININYRISVKEYFDCNNTNIPKTKKLIQKEEYTKLFFNKFVNGDLNFEIIEKLRNYRDKNIDIQEIETGKSLNEKKPQINGLSDFLEGNSFPLQTQGKLLKSETQYITGGWFEEYIFSKLKEDINPQDIVIGVELPIANNRQISNRDLDVVFTYENKLFVIECKTGIDGEKMFNETVYKAAALKNEKLGKLSANTSIFSLSGENEKFREIARALGINYYDKSFFIDEKKFIELLNNIDKKAKG
jgi:hypothetical protein